MQTKVLQKPITEALLRSIQKRNDQRRAEVIATMGPRYVCSQAASKQIKHALSDLRAFESAERRRTTTFG